MNDRVTEFRAGFRTKQVKILTISFLIPSRFSYSKVHIPSHYSRQILILELFCYVQKFFTQVLANFVFSFSTLLGLVEKKTTVYYKENFNEYLPRIMRRYLHLLHGNRLEINKIMLNILTRFVRLPARNSVNPVIYTT